MEEASKASSGRKDEQKGILDEWLEQKHEEEKEQSTL